MLCKLTPFQKIRLCNSIMNAEGYRGQVEFAPETKNIEPQCVLRELTFLYEEVVEKEATAGEPDTYKALSPVTEWMVPCQITNLKTQQSTTRYILRGAQNHDNSRFYVGLMGGDESVTYLESVIGEKKDPETQTEATRQEANEEDEEEEEEGNQHEFFSRTRGGDGGGARRGGAEEMFSFFF